MCNLLIIWWLKNTDTVADITSVKSTSTSDMDDMDLSSAGLYRRMMYSIQLGKEVQMIGHSNTF